MVNEPRLDTISDVFPWIHGGLNKVCDPCGLAQGLSLGIIDMGLVRSISVEHNSSKWNISIGIRFTSAGCYYFPYFENEIRSQLGDHSRVNSLEVTWDNVIDWTPEDLSGSAKTQMEEHTKILSTAILQK